MLHVLQMLTEHLKLRLQKNTIVDIAKRTANNNIVIASMEAVEDIFYVIYATSQINYVGTCNSKLENMAATQLAQSYFAQSWRNELEPINYIEMNILFLNSKASRRSIAQID